MQIHTLFYAFSFLSPLILLTGIIVGAVFYRAISASGRLIWWYFLAMFLIDVTSRLVLLTSSKNNLIFLSIAGIADVAFLSVLYLRYFQITYRKLLMLLSVTVLLNALLSVLVRDIGVIANYNGYDKSFCDGLLIIFALISTLDQLNGRKPLHHGVLGINAGILLYYSMDLLLSLVWNFLINAGVEMVFYFVFLRLALLLILYSIFVYNLWQTGKNRKL